MHVKHSRAHRWIWAGLSRIGVCHPIVYKPAGIHNSRALRASPIDVSGKVQIFVTPERMRGLANAQSRPILDRAAARLAEAEMSHTVEMLEGDPAEVIGRRAQELGCDAIVMGSRGMGRIANLVVGSVATKVVHLTKLPVTLVK